MRSQRAAWTAGVAVSGFFLAIVLTVAFCIAVSRLRRPFLSDRYFFVTVRLLRRRVKMTGDDFARLAQAFNRARAWHPLFEASPFINLVFCYHFMQFFIRK
jgi:hypothetical protein